MASKPVYHGPDHGPRSADPSYTERWHVVGDTDEPALLAGTPIADYLDTCFRLIVGPPNQAKHTLEVVINLDDVTDGDTAFTLPDGYYDFANGKKVPIHGHDSSGAYKAWHLDGATGDIVAGV